MTAQPCVIDIMISAVVVQRDVRPEGRPQGYRWPDGKKAAARHGDRLEPLLQIP